MRSGSRESVLGPKGARRRPGSAIGIGVFCALGAGVLLFSALTSSPRNWTVASLCTLALVLVWLFVVHPHVRLDRDGVTIVNPLRTAHISWPAVTEVRSRWMLDIVTAANTYSAWGVPSDPARPRYGREFFRLGANKVGDQHAPTESARAARKVSAQRVAAEVDTRRAEDRKRRDVKTPSIATHAWDPTSVGLLVAALAFVAVSWLAG